MKTIHDRQTIRVCFAPVLFVAACALPVQAEDDNPHVEIVGVHKIWDKAPHNAFTDLARFQGRWYCVFREGKGHVSPDGALRVIASVDGVDWQSMARITSDTSDLRDAKLTVTPGGQLMLAVDTGYHGLPSRQAVRRSRWKPREECPIQERRRPVNWVRRGSFLCLQHTPDRDGKACF